MKSGPRRVQGSLADTLALPQEVLQERPLRCSVTGRKTVERSFGAYNHHHVHPLTVAITALNVACLPWSVRRSKLRVARSVPDKPRAEPLQALQRLPVRGLDADRGIQGEATPVVPLALPEVQLKADPSLRDIPVIMFSALDEIQSVVRCIEHGAEDYLPKPFNPVLLRARIGACLDKKRLRD